jgi:secondary thiamine-phosphate synthase enzyme
MTQVPTEVQTRMDSPKVFSLGGLFSFVIHAGRLSLQTPQPTAQQLGLVDLTDKITALAARTQLDLGAVILYSPHTTCAVVINEKESLLMKDVAQFLNGLAPRDGFYLHNQFDIRTENLNPDEFPNGHAHCQAWLLPTHQLVPVSGGRLNLGRWQRIFLVELDSARPRELVVQVWGLAGPVDAPAPTI